MKARHYIFRVLAIVSIMTINFSVLAQSQVKEQPPATRQGGDPFGLLMIESVQKELKLTNDQSHSLEQTYNSLQKMQCELMTGGEKPSRHQLQKMEKEAKMARDQMMQVLHTNQQVRFRELLLQLSGWGALLDPEMIKAFDGVLDIGMLQKWRLSRLGGQVRQQMMEISGKGEQTKKAFLDDTNKKVWEIFSSEQQTILKGLIGKKFTLTATEPPPQPACGAKR